MPSDKLLLPISGSKQPAADDASCSAPRKRFSEILRSPGAECVLAVWGTGLRWHPYTQRMYRFDDLHTSFL